MTKIPIHWKKNSWEDKARENPLFAVMTVPELADADAEGFTEEQLEMFFIKGRKLVGKWLLPHLDDVPEEGVVLDYGCGAGRLLNALVENGVPCSGVDISPTMIKLCGRLVSGVRDLVVLDENGDVGLPDHYARLVFSYAVVQHIDTLSAHTKALSEMCRLLMPGGKLVVQVNCEDYTEGHGEDAGRTENFEDHSVHYPPGGGECWVHKHATWSGVYIGRELLMKQMEQFGIEVEQFVPYNPKKPRTRVLIGKKK